jgi:23S rRNA pseudouridine1911/1915/1917 synthase
VMVVAKNDKTHTALSRLFAAHDLTRIYKALVWGAPQPKAGTIEAALGRHPVDRKRMAVRKTSGKHAITDYWLETRYGPPLQPLASLMGAKLHTGRTHQVRVHLAHIGCPVIGDPLYGRQNGRGRNGPAAQPLKDFKRQALHAAVLEFIHPGTGRAMKFATELPQDMASLVSQLNDVK